MRKTILITAGFLAAFGLGFYANTMINPQPEKKRAKKKENPSAIHTNNEKKDHMKLGAFSISLSVKDLEVSKAFYENLGFTHFAGSMEQHYLIMKNENALIGLFQGMFEGNILTFNPGWDENAKNIEQFDDVRTIQQQLKSKGIAINGEVDEKASGPAGFMITDPDGNVVLIDQHR